MIVKIELRFSNIDDDVLLSSLSDLSIQWEPELNRVRGYKDQTTFANLVIRQDNNYDIGFSWNGFEYQLVADIQRIGPAAVHRAAGIGAEHFFGGCQVGNADAAAQLAAP